MADEDFTTFSAEADPGDDFSFTSSTVTGVNVVRNTDTWLADDKGVNHFSGDFEHDVDASQDEAYKNNIDFGFWGVSNDLDSPNDIDVANGSCLLVKVLNVSPTIRIYVIEIDGGTFYNSSNFDISASTTYYFEIERDESIGSYGDIICRIYSDASHTTLLDTLTVSLHTSKKDFRYIQSIWPKGEGAAVTMDLTIANLDLKEAVGLSIPVAMAGYRHRHQSLG